jgi:raffinose/stachyose/melibiose transport system permease protein
MKRRRILGVVIGVVAVLASVVIFLIPFAFILVTAAKTTQEAANLDFTWPTSWQL